MNPAGFIAGIASVPSVSAGIPASASAPVVNGEGVGFASALGALLDGADASAGMNSTTVSALDGTSAEPVSMDDASAAALVDLMDQLGLLPEDPGAREEMVAKLLSGDGETISSVLEGIRKLLENVLARVSLGGQDASLDPDAVNADSVSETISSADGQDEQAWMAQIASLLDVLAQQLQSLQPVANETNGGSPEVSEDSLAANDRSSLQGNMGALFLGIGRLLGRIADAEDVDSTATQESDATTGSTDSESVRQAQDNLARLESVLSRLMGGERASAASVAEKTLQDVNPVRELAEDTDSDDPVLEISEAAAAEEDASLVDLSDSGQDAHSNDDGSSHSEKTAQRATKTETVVQAQTVTDTSASQSETPRVVVEDQIVAGSNWTQKLRIVRVEVSENTGTRMSEMMEKVKVLGQVAENVRVLADAGGGRMTMTLHPEQLGQVSLKVEMLHDGIKVHMQVENESVKQVLESSAPQLREALERDHQVSLQRMEVSVENGRSQSREEDRRGRQNRSKGNHAGDRIMALPEDSLARKMGYNALEWVG